MLLAEALNRPQTIARTECERAVVLFAKGNLRQAIGAAERALASARTAQMPLIASEMGAHLVSWYGYSGAYDRMVETYDQQRDTLIDGPADLVQGRLLYSEARVAFYLRQYHRALKPACDAYALLRPRVEAWSPGLPVVAVAVAIGQGDLAAAEAVLDWFPEDAQGMRLIKASRFMVEAMIAHAKGDFESARANFNRCYDLPTAQLRIPAAALTAWLALEDGDVQECRRMLGLVGSFAQDATMGRLVSARLAYEEGDYAGAVARITDADRSPQFPFHDYHRESRRVYCEALETGTPGSLSRIPALTLLW